MCKRTHVPDKLEGYMLQVRHALYNLISTDEVVVSIEGYDDVAVETKETVIAEQTKSVLSANNPVTDKAVSFWKTVYNWSQYVEKGEFPSKQLVFRYVIIAAHKLSVGSIPQSFFDAKDKEQAKQALEAARKVLLNEEKKSFVVSSECLPYVSHCFSSKNEDFVIETIVAMELDLHEETYDEDLRAKFNRQVIPPEYSEELLIYMLGWVYEKVHQYTKINEPAYIKSTEYREALLKEVRGLNTSAILSAVSSVPNYQETGDEVSRRDVYIKQLELIEMDSTELFSAASDYLRTKAEVTAWARKGLVTDSSFSDYNDSLIRIWKNEKIHTELMPYDSVGKGRLLYSKCNNAVTNKPLQGKTVPSFLGSGSLHALANEPSEQPKIGWHPNYVDMLKEENDE